MFSGRSNPVWVVADEQEARATLRELSKNRSVFTTSAAPNAGLGFRGLTIDVLNDELAKDHDVTTSLYLPMEGVPATGTARDIAERLVSLAVKSETSAAAEGAPVIDEALQAFMLQQLDRVSGVSAPDSGGALPEETAEAAAAVTCTIEFGAYNPGFWNNNPTILHNNNCYNYASNKRTDTFAQPGRGCGHMYTAINCVEVTRAALCDGLHHRYQCFPDSEKPRYLVALVIAPGPGFVDYHWYRKNKEGFWSHKPGGTPVRNVDNSGHVITDPSRCDRGPYTIFCGYFYTCRTQKIR
jgi:hypothetical protein